MAWKKLSTKKILDHPRLQVYEDIVELPNGKRTDYVYEKSCNSAMVIALNDKGKILQQEEYNYVHDVRLLEFPGGGIDDGEDPMAGAARELQEEAGLEGALTFLGTFYADNRRKTQIMYVYVATELKKVDDQQEETEDRTNDWYTVAEISQLIRENKLNNWSSLAAWALFVNSDFYKA